MHPIKTSPPETGVSPNVAEAGCGHIALISGGALAAPWSFAAILDALSPERFNREYWGKRPLRITRPNPDYFRDLISLAELESHFSLSDFFEQQSVATPSREYGPPDPALTSPNALYERIHSGRSLRLRRMERYLNPASPSVSLVRDMEHVLQHPLDSISCYVSPEATSGLGPHHDDSEIFTLQISGCKRWKLFHRVDAAESGVHRSDELGCPIDDFVLEAGDFFYLPRGQVHEVTTAGTGSFSLTIVFSPFQWSALLNLLSERLAKTAPFLESLPAGFVTDGARSDSFREQFSERLRLIGQTLSELTVESLIDDLACQRAHNAIMPADGHLGSLLSLPSISDETWLERRPGVVCHLARRDDSVKLTLAGGYAMELKTTAERALRRAIDADGPFPVCQMDESLPRGARLALAKKLVVCGLLRPAPEREGSAIQ